MNKLILATALTIGICLPTYAAQFDNQGDAVYESPVFDENKESSDVVEKGEREKKDV